MTTQHTLRTGKTTTFLNVKARDWKRRGVVTEGRCRDGHHVSITPGESVRVWGASDRYVPTEVVGRPVVKFVRYDTTFRIGDTAVYDSMNVTFTGPIVAIGASTVTIRNDYGRNVRLDLEQFSHFNDHFDLAKIAKHNAEWLD